MATTFRDRLLIQLRDFVQTLDDEVIKRFDVQISLVSRIDHLLLEPGTSLDRILTAVCADLAAALSIAGATVLLPLADRFVAITSDGTGDLIQRVTRDRYRELVSLQTGRYLVLREDLPSPLTSVCFIPILNGDAVTGMLVIATTSETQHGLLETDTIPYASFIATRLGLIVKHFEDLRAADLKWSLVQIFFDKNLDSAATWRRIIERISAFVPDWGPLALRPAPKAQLLSFNEGDKFLRIIGTQGEEAPGTEVLVDSSICGLAVEKRSPFILVNPRDYPLRYKGFLINGTESIPQSELVVGVYHDDRLIGLLNFEHATKGAFQPQHIQAVQVASHYLSPFLAALRERHDKERTQQLGILYTISNLLTRTARTYQHLVGQPLVLMRLTSEKLMKAVSDSPNCVAMVEQLQEQMDRINISSKRFCQALPRVIEFGPIPPRKAVEGALSVFNLSRLRDEDHIEISHDVGDDVPDVYASSLLQEHIYNLVDNSLYSVRQAIIRGNIKTGEIRIAGTKKDVLDNRGQPTGSVVVELRISDNGMGVPPEGEDVLKTPGKTTKGALGSGYGLSAAKEYVQTIRGTFSVHNEPGIGFRVTMVLEQYDERKHLRRLLDAPQPSFSH